MYCKLTSMSIILNSMLVTIIESSWQTASTIMKWLPYCHSTFFCCRFSALSRNILLIPTIRFIRLCHLQLPFLEQRGQIFSGKKGPITISHILTDLFFTFFNLAEYKYSLSNLGLLLCYLVTYWINLRRSNFAVCNRSQRNQCFEYITFYNSDIPP